MHIKHRQIQKNAHILNITMLKVSRDSENLCKILQPCFLFEKIVLKINVALFQPYWFFVFFATATIQGGDIAGFSQPPLSWITAAELNAIISLGQMFTQLHYTNGQQAQGVIAKFHDVNIFTVFLLQLKHHCKINSVI